MKLLSIIWVRESMDLKKQILPQNLLKDQTMKVNAILKGIKSENITESNRLIRACAIFVGRKVGLKPNQKRENALKEPWLKRIHQSIQELRKHINIAERKKRGEIIKKRERQSNRTQTQSQGKKIKCSS